MDSVLFCFYCSYYLYFSHLIIVIVINSDSTFQNALLCFIFIYIYSHYVFCLLRLYETKSVIYPPDKTLEFHVILRLETYVGYEDMYLFCQNKY